MEVPAQRERLARPHDWDALVPPGRGPARTAYIKAWQHAELRALASRPVVVPGRDSPEPVAAAPGYFYDLDLVSVRTPLLERIVTALRHLSPRLMIARVYELGCPAAGVDPLLVADDADARDALERLLGRALEEFSRGNADMMIVQDFEAGDGPANEALSTCGFSAVPIPPTVVVDLPFGSFDDYLGAMRSQYRRRARRVLEHSDHLSCELVRDFAPLVPELARLWELVFERADEVKREFLPPAFFEDVAGLEEVSALVLRRPDGSIASYALLFDDEPWLHFLYCGFEEKAGVDESAYFRLLYEIVRDAIERGFEHVNLGITTVEPKLDVGGRPVPLCGWIKHRNLLLQRAFAAVGRGPFAPGPAEPRHVFKD